MNTRTKTARTSSGRDGAVQLLQSILDLTKSMEQSADAEDFDGVTAMMGRRESLLDEYSAVRHQADPGPGANDLIRAIDRENSILMARLQQKRDLIAERLETLQKERAIAHYRQ